MRPEPTVPVATLEKLWRRFRRYGSLADGRFRRAPGVGPGFIHAAAEASAFGRAAADLRAIIAEAKKGEIQ